MNSGQTRSLRLAACGRRPGRSARVGNWSAIQTERLRSATALRRTGARLHHRRDQSRPAIPPDRKFARTRCRCRVSTSARCPGASSRPLRLFGHDQEINRPAPEQPGRGGPTEGCIAIGLAEVEDEPRGPWRSDSWLGILVSVRFCGLRLLVSVCLVTAALVGVLALRSTQATGARRDQAPCTWGASSVSAEVVDGKLVVSQAATSGCIPK
jgi:hypothetical protein